MRAYQKSLRKTEDQPSLPRMAKVNHSHRSGSEGKSITQVKDDDLHIPKTMVLSGLPT